jgi:hypothetical protein
MFMAFSSAGEPAGGLAPALAVDLKGIPVKNKGHANRCPFAFVISPLPLAWLYAFSNEECCTDLRFSPALLLQFRTAGNMES